MNFVGTQGIGKRRRDESGNNFKGEEWELSVIIHQVDYQNGKLVGTMRATDMPKSKKKIPDSDHNSSIVNPQSVTTHWEGTI